MPLFLANLESWIAFTCFYERGAGFMWLLQVLIGLLERLSFPQELLDNMTDRRKSDTSASQESVLPTRVYPSRA